ncbi:MAG TPA: type II toxin-antitoxin system VapC family toxin [Intrasporangiaceae bacterium]|nr:type II toxin-antitoxin system VapC family toxin [Intrasporangiaceae bacterium]
MAELLLDTHAVMWAINEPDRLSDLAREQITDSANRIVVSAASSWELATKHRLGKLPQAGAMLAVLEESLQRLGADPLAISHRHALLAGSLDWEHRDPFDRVLAAQAMIESLVLVTIDAAFDTVAGLRCLW